MKILLILPVCEQTRAMRVESSQGMSLPGPRSFLTCGIALCAMFGGDRIAAGEVELSSPDKAIEFKVFTEGGRIRYRVMFNRKPVIEPSPMTIMLDGVDLSEGAELGEAKRYDLNESYPWRGVHAEAKNKCHGATIPVLKGDLRFTLEIRVFSDGAAFRHVIPGGENPRVPDEGSAFTLPPGSTVWYHDLEGHYEAVHEKKDAGDVAADQWVAPPLTFKLPGGGGYAAITEAALANYSGMALQAGGARVFKVVLGHKHPASYPFRLRYKNDVERVLPTGGDFRHDHDHRGGS